MVRSLRIGHRRFVINNGVNTIGREPGCNVCLNDVSVSRVHARITVQDDRVTLEDLQSKNGTSVMGEPLKGAVVLKDGDEVEFGHVKGWFIVEISDDPPTTTHL